MKQRMKQTIAVLLCVLLLFGAAPAAGIAGLADVLSFNASAVYSGTYGDLWWQLNPDRGLLTISGSGSMPYPDGGYAPWYDYMQYIQTVQMSDSITSLSDCAFSGCRYLTSVTIGSGVRTIGIDAFNDCVNLKTLTIPDNVTMIESNVFFECDSLESVTIGSGLTTLFLPNFQACPSLTRITVSEDNTAFSSDANGVLYNKDKTALIRCPQGVPCTTFEIPESVEKIGEDAFRSCTNLQSVTIGSRVTDIHLSAFKDCTNLLSVTIDDDNPSYSSDECGMLYNKDKTVLLRYLRGTPSAVVTIPEGVTHIGDYAFDFCDGVESVIFPESLTHIGYRAFVSCYSLAGVTFTGSNLKTIGQYAFSGCYDLAAVTIPDGVTDIDTQAFYYCTKLADITLPDSVRAIGANAFSNTAYARDAGKWTNDILYIGRHLIKANASVSDANCIAAGTVSIADSAFSDCSSLTQITIPEGVLSVNGSFKGCAALESVTLPQSLLRIGDSSFRGCEALTQITIPENVQSIGKEAFYRCLYLTRATISDGVTFIGDSAFNYCPRLEDVTLPDSVEWIGKDAFQSAAAIGDARYRKRNLVYFGNQLIREYLPDRMACIVPDGTVCIAGRAFADCNAVTRVTVTDTVQSIGDDAFRSCRNLESVVICPRIALGAIDGEQLDDPLGSLPIDEADLDGTSLADISDGDGGRRVGDNAFRSCAALQFVHIPHDVTQIGSDILKGSAAYICSDSENCAAKAYAEANGIEFRVCSGHDTTHEHTYTSVVTEATCTSGGYTTQTCYGCGDVVVSDEIAALGHNWDDGVFRNAPTCTVKGIRSYTCTRCGETRSNYVDALGHDYDEAVIAATCTEGGYTTYTCTRCGVSYTADETEPLGHDYDEAVIAATCAAGGYTTYTCTRCGDSYTADETDALGHDYDEAVIAAICTEGGYTTYTCTRCGDSYTADETDPLGHVWGAWTVVTPPAIGAAGLQKRDCTRCGDTQEESIDPLREDTGIVRASDAVVGALAGRQVRVSVVLSDNPGIVSVRLHIGYDSSRLSLVRVQNGDVFPEDAFTAGGDLTAEPYTVLWLDALTHEDYTADGTLVTLTFEVLPTATAGETAVTVTCDGASTRNSALQRIPLETVDGSISVVECMSGDSDGDGEIGLADVAAMCRALAGGWDVTVNAVNADVSGDGAFDLKDVILLRRYLAGGWDVELK